MAEQCRIFPNLLEGLRAHGEFVPYPMRSYSAVMFPSTPISTLLTKQSRRADFAFESIISYAESSFMAYLISSFVKFFESSESRDSSSSSWLRSAAREMKLGLMSVVILMHATSFRIPARIVKHLLTEMIHYRAFSSIRKL